MPLCQCYAGLKLKFHLSVFLRHNLITISFSIWSLYDLFYPFMESFVSDDPTRDMLRQTADSLKEWTTSLNSNSNGK